jgi:DHA1 family tetracycline resistance protein-like MFS transporter
MNRKPALGIIFLTVFIDLVGFGMIIPIVGLYGQEFKATAFQLGVLGALYSLMQFLFSPFWGRLSDKYGRRPILLISLLGSALSYWMFGLAQSVSVLMISRALAGSFGANISAAQAYIADITTPENRAKGMGMIGAAFGLGFILGPPLGGLAAHHSLSLPGYIAAGICGLNFALAIFLLPESLPKEKRRVNPGQRWQWNPLNGAMLKKAMQEPLLPGLLLILFSITFAFTQVEQTFSLLFKVKFSLDTSHAAQTTGWVLMWLGLLIAIVQGGLIGPLTKKLGERNLLLMGLGFYALGISLLPVFSNLPAFMMIMVPLALGSGLVNPSLSALISKQAASHEQGETLGLAQSIGSLARTLGPFLGLWAFLKDIRLPFALGGMISLFLFIFWLFKKRVRI